MKRMLKIRKPSLSKKKKNKSLLSNLFYFSYFYKEPKRFLKGTSSLIDRKTWSLQRCRCKQCIITGAQLLLFSCIFNHYLIMWIIRCSLSLQWYDSQYFPLQIFSQHQQKWCWTVWSLSFGTYSFVCLVFLIKFLICFTLHSPLFH